MPTALKQTKQKRSGGEISRRTRPLDCAAIPMSWERPVRRSEFPKFSVLPHIAFARRSPLRAAGPFTAVGLASTSVTRSGSRPRSAWARWCQPPCRGRPSRRSTSRRNTAFDPSPFILNALLVPALDDDARCAGRSPAEAALRPGTVVRVNGLPLRAPASWCRRSVRAPVVDDQCYPFRLHEGSGRARGRRLTMSRAAAEHGQHRQA